MKERIIEIIKEKQKEYEFGSIPYNALIEIEERIKGLSQPSEKPAIEDIFCPYCGIEKEHIIPSDANSGRVCRYSLCRGGVIISQEKPSAEEWFKQNYSKSYEKMGKAAKYYVKPRMDMELVFYIMEQYAKQ